MMIHRLRLRSSRNRLTLRLVPESLASACTVFEDVFVDRRRFCIRHLTYSQVDCDELEASSLSLSLNEPERNA